MIVLSLIIFIINYHNKYFILSSINLFTFLYGNNPSLFGLQLILLTISNPAIACSNHILNCSNFGHELILSPIDASMLNLLSSKIIKVYTYCELL